MLQISLRSRGICSVEKAPYCSCCIWHESDDGHAGFAFPNCLGNLNISVSGSGTPPPTGDVTLGLTGGIYNSKSAVLGTVGLDSALYDCSSDCLASISLEYSCSVSQAGWPVSAGYELARYHVLR